MNTGEINGSQDTDDNPMDIMNARKNQKSIAMKIFLSTSLFLIASLTVWAQTDGISYQAVILDPNPREIPGVDFRGGILPNATIVVRFTILDQNNKEEYQEVQTTKTDAYGMINLIIGKGDPVNLGVGDFTLIDWDGKPRSLQVEIDFDGAGSNYVDLNRQELTFAPYAFHRNITATGNLKVDGTTDLNGVLTVQGPTDLNNSLEVTNGNPTLLSGPLNVGSETHLNDKLTVEGKILFNDSVNINNQRPAYFTGNLSVDGASTFNGPAIFNSPVGFTSINVAGPSDLYGQVTVRANMDTVGEQSQYQAYPLLVEGSKQGIAIKVNESRAIRNNYMSFWDNDNQMWGRIEGITIDELEDDPEFQIEHAVRITDIVINGIEAGLAIVGSGQAVVKLTAAATSSTACVGLGACVTTPIPSLIVESSSNLIIKIAAAVAIGGNLALAIVEEANFIYYAHQNIGVSYQSGAGDYAEWLPKLNPSEVFIDGEVVGVKNGMVTKEIWDAEKVMVVSTRPIVLGNMPPKDDENNYVKIAFIGQVSTRVIGPVQPGDYILPSEIGSGFAKAVHPETMKSRDYKKVAGVVWSVLSKVSDNISLVNVAVGINSNDLADVVQKHEEELLKLRSEYNDLQRQANAANAALAKLVPGYAEAIGLKDQQAPPTTEKATKDKHVVEQTGEDVIYFTISRQQIEAALEMSREQYLAMLDDDETKRLLFKKDNMPALKSENKKGAVSEDDKLKKAIEKQVLMPIKDHPFWKKIDAEPQYREEIIQYVLAKFEKAVHTHKKHAHKFTDLKVAD